MSARLFHVLTAALSTSDATNTFGSLSITLNQLGGVTKTIVCLELRVLAKITATGELRFWKRRATFLYTTGAVPTKIGATVDDTVPANDAALNTAAIDFDVGVVEMVRTKLNGVAATTIEWLIEMRIMAH